jgi:prevent-host-death family protein
MISMTKMTVSGGANAATTWTVAEAKARFSEIIDRALAGGPQIVTRRGRPAVIVISAEEWQRKTKRIGNLAEFFATSPLRGARLNIKHTKEHFPAESMGGASLTPTAPLAK